MEKINVALTSFGMSGKVFHGPLLKVAGGFRVKKVLERSKKESDALFPEAEIVRNYDKILTDPKIDLIVVNVPDHLHYSFTMKALNAGKHVVVEKPFTLNVAEGEGLIDLADKKGKVLTVFQNRRWDSDFLTVKRIISEGWLGQIKEFEEHFDRFKDAVIKGTWKENADLGSNVLYNLGSHLVDQALVLFSMPKAVFADLAKVRDGTRVIDYFHVHLYYETFKVILKSSYQAKEPGPKFMIHGSNGSFIKYGMDVQEDALKQGALPAGPGWGSEPAEIYGRLNYASGKETYNGHFRSLPGNYPVFYRNLYETVVSGKEPDVKPGEALNVIRVIKAAEKSHQAGCIVQL